MRRTGVFLTVFLLAIRFPLFAQQATFVGTVTDSLTGSPLAGASVSVLGQDVIVLTGLNGRFELAGVGSGNVLVEIRRPGFRVGSVEFEITVTRAVTVDLGTVALSPLVVELDPVVVEGAKCRRKANQSGILPADGHGTWYFHHSRGYRATKSQKHRRSDQTHTGFSRDARGRRQLGF
jgi:hypothetical protein